MSFLAILKNWKLILFSGILIGYTIFIWKIHTWHDAKLEAAILTAQLNAAKKAESDVIQFNQKWDALPDDSWESVVIPPVARQLLK